LNEAAKEVIWINNLLNELGFPQEHPPIVMEDNTSTIQASENPVQHSKLKHVDIKFHQNREFVQQKKITIFHVATNEQLADSLTKAVSAIEQQRSMQQLMNIPQRS
jgi:hypothetical protein